MIPFGVTAKQRLLNLMKCALRNVLLETPAPPCGPLHLVLSTGLTMAVTPNF